MTYRAAVIGLGRIGWQMETDSKRPKPATHVGAWLACPRAALVAVCDTDRQRLEDASRGIGFGWPDASVIYALDVPPVLRTPLDIVSIATPPNTHREIVEACAAASVRAIVCEKPLAPTSGDCRAMIAACAASGSRLFVNHSRRFDPILRAAAAAVPRRLGELVQVVGHYSGGDWNSGTHMVDLIRLFCGEVRWALYVTPDTWGKVLQLEEECCQVSLLGHESEYAIFDLHLYGKRGALHITDSGFTLRWERPEEHPHFSGYHALVSGPADMVLVPRSFMAPMVEHVCDVLDGVTEPISTGDDGLMAVRVLEAIHGAARGPKHV